MGLSPTDRRNPSTPLGWILFFDGVGVHAVHLAIARHNIGGGRRRLRPSLSSTTIKRPNVPPLVPSGAIIPPPGGRALRAPFGRDDEDDDDVPSHLVAPRVERDGARQRSRSSS